LSNTLLTRSSDGSFSTSDAQLRELAVYLDTLQLPQFITKAHIVLHKSLVLYEPEYTLQYGKPWYDRLGNLTNPNGDENKMKQPQDYSAAYREVWLAILDWRWEHFGGPMVLYENEPQGKNVVDVKVVLLNDNDCWIDSLDISFYRLPNPNDPVNIDNVDGGNENYKVVLQSCCYDENGRDEDRYFWITGGATSVYPERAKDLRFEWETQNHREYIRFSGANQGAHHNVLFDGERVNYTRVGYYPHLREPIVALEEPKQQGEDYNLIVKLPKYFDGHRVANYIVIECINETTVNVRMVKGKVQRNFPVVISRDPADAEVKDSWWYEK